MVKFAKKKQKQSDDFTLEDVLEKGGNTEDYNLLRDLEHDGKNKIQSKEDNIRNDVAGYLNKLKKEEKMQKKTKLMKEKKKPRWRSKMDTTSQTPAVQPSAISFQLSNKFGNLDMPTQQMVMTFLPWHSVLSSEPKGKVDASFEFLDELKNYATILLQKETSFFQKFSKSARKDGNSSWVKTAAAAGTTKDRVAALSLLCEEAPLHNLSSFETLLNMTKKDIKREAIIGVEAIKNLLIKALLPDERRLRFFHQHPLDKVYLTLMSKENENEDWSLETCQRFLILWIFEDRLKRLMNEYLSLISNLSLDPLHASKSKALDVAFALLRKKPEGEKEFLAVVVNKLGDPSTKHASRALNALQKISEEHPMMQGVIIKAVRDLLLTPKLASRAQYYCICFLSEQLLSKDRKEIADNLLRVYMNFFKSLLNRNDRKEQERNNKIMAALLTGVSRALPFAELNEDVVDKVNELYRAAHHPKMNTVVRALSILFQILESNHENADRFYNAFYSVLFHSELPTAYPQQAMFLNLFFRAVKFDSSDVRRDAFVKRGLQLMSLCGPPFTAALLTVMSQLVKEKPVFAQHLRHTPFDTHKDEKMNAFKDDDDDEEQFYDVDKGKNIREKNNLSNTTVESSWVHKSKQSEKSSESATSLRDYDPLYRNPRFCGVEKAAFWELHNLTRHFHPTVALYAQSLLSPSDTNPFSGDPFTDYTLIKFLDRFVYRNPKSAKKEEPEDRRIKYYQHHSRLNYVKKSHRHEIPANTSSFLEKKVFHPEEVFFQKYFMMPSVKSRHGKKKRDDDEKDEDRDLSDGEFEEFINSAEGQKEVAKEMRFFDHISKSGAAKSKKDEDMEDSDDEDETSWDQHAEDDSQMDDEEEDAGSSAGVFITGGAEPKKRKKKVMKSAQKKKMKIIGDELGEMLADTGMDELDTITSAATIVKDRAGAKQLKWERKRELKEILQRKRESRHKNADKKQRLKGKKRGGKQFAKEKKFRGAKK